MNGIEIKSRQSSASRLFGASHYVVFTILLFCVNQTTAEAHEFLYAIASDGQAARVNLQTLYVETGKVELGDMGLLHMCFDATSNYVYAACLPRLPHGEIVFLKIKSSTWKVENRLSVEGVYVPHMTLCNEGRNLLAKSWVIDTQSMKVTHVLDKAISLTARRVVTPDQKSAYGIYYPHLREADGIVRRFDVGESVITDVGYISRRYGLVRSCILGQEGKSIYCLAGDYDYGLSYLLCYDLDTGMTQLVSKGICGDFLDGSSTGKLYIDKDELVPDSDPTAFWKFRRQRSGTVLAFNTVTNEIETEFNKPLVSSILPTEQIDGVPIITLTAPNGSKVYYRKTIDGHQRMVVVSTDDKCKGTSSYERIFYYHEGMVSPEMNKIVFRLGDNFLVFLDANSGELLKRIQVGAFSPQIGLKMVAE